MAIQGRRSCRQRDQRPRPGGRRGQRKLQSPMGEGRRTRTTARAGRYQARIQECRQEGARTRMGHPQTVTPGLKRCIRTRKVGIRMIRVAHVTDQKVVPLACPMRWSTEGCHGRSQRIDGTDACGSPPQAPARRPDLRTERRPRIPCQAEVSGPRDTDGGWMGASPGRSGRSSSRRSAHGPGPGAWQPVRCRRAARRAIGATLAVRGWLGALPAQSPLRWVACQCGRARVTRTGEAYEALQQSTPVGRPAVYG